MARGKKRTQTVGREVPLSDSVRTPLAPEVEVFEPDPEEPRVVDVLSEWSAQVAEQAREARERALEALRGAGVKKVTAGYDGGGDEGSVESVDLDPEPEQEIPDLELLLEGLIYSIVGDWGLGDGGYGTLELDVESGEARLEHNKRVQAVDTTSYKV